MFALPTLDIDALQAAGHVIDQWPEEARGDFDGRLPPQMKLLLAADPGAARAMATLGEDFEFLDVDPDDPKQIDACATLARAIQELMIDLGRRGPVAMCERLSATLGRNVSQAEGRAIVAGLSAETIHGALRAWFPGKEVDLGKWPNSPAGLGDVDPLHAVAFAPAGAWSRDDASVSIRYRPAGHADPVMTGWLELLAAMPNLAKHPLAIAMHKELSKPTAPGLCASCHSVEQATDGKVTINWRAHDRTQEPREFTNFSHGPHLVLPQLADCTPCHTIHDASDTTGSYAGWDPQQFVSEFAPLSKQSCVECHTAKAAGESCQQCHNYHVEAMEGWRVR
jgi:hypothetical protein